MYEMPEPFRLAGLQLDLPGPADALSLADALAQARRVFDDFAPGAALDRDRLRKALRRQAPAPGLDRERIFVLGWLAWLDGNLGVAETVLADAEARCREATEDQATGEPLPMPPAQLLARATYWLARVRLLAGKASALSEYEAALRRLSGWPQATAWYVDLLWRSGRVDRAEQVWKSVRGNKRVAACEEAGLLDARGHLRRGELVPAERLLREATVTGGVAWVERHLFLAWALAGQRQFEKAREAVAQATQGPYPDTALAAWRAMLDARPRGALVGADQAPALWQPLLRAQADRAAGRFAEAAAGYREAAALALLQPQARYGLACLGHEDPAVLLAAAPGMFLAVRCRARVAMARFARREIGPGELLEAMQQAARAGYEARAADHYSRLARGMQLRLASRSGLQALVEAEAKPAERGNAMRVGLGLLDALPPGEAGELLADWLGDESVRDDAELQAALGRAARRVKVQSEEGPVSSDDDSSPGLLRRITDRLADGQGLDEPDRGRLRELVALPAYRPVAQAILLYDAAARNDADAAADQLDGLDGWRHFRPGPPRFVVTALAALVGAHPSHIAWRQLLARWLQLWPLPQLGAEGSALAAAAGLSLPADEAAVPPGVEPGAWFLHQASRAVRRNAPGEALALIRRASETGPLPPDAAAARSALECLADAEALAALPGAAAPAVLAGLAAEVRRLPEGEALLAAVRAGDADTWWRLLDERQAREGLSPRLHHHLALLATRAARHQEHADPAEAALTWRRAWGHWLALLTSDQGPGAVARGALLDHLLTQHRARLNELLRQGDIEAARRYSELVRKLSDMVGPEHLALREDLARRGERFRDELATEHLLNTREAMRYGDIPEGWKADYERGLTALRRLMALDRDNVRLLTAVVETCVEWFVDLYNTQDAERLRQEVERYAPLAAHLVRLIANQGAEHPARPALSELYKFRGFVEPDPGSRIALYREALRLCPANDNVRDLLAELEGDAPRGDDDER